MGTPLIGALSTIGGGLIGGVGSYLGMQELAKAQRQATKVTRQNFEDTRDLLQPSVSAGNTARNYTLGALGLPGGASYDEAMSAFRTSPGYDFRLNEGRDAVQGSAAAGGNLFSGKTLKDLTRFGQDYASNEFGNWMNGLGGLSGGGMRATGALADAGTGTSRTLADLALGGGQARASSYAGMGLAGAGTFQGLADLHNRYNPPGLQKNGGHAGGPMPGTSWNYGDWSL